MAPRYLMRIKEHIQRYYEPLVLTITMIAVIFLLGGGLYDLVERPLWFVVLQSPSGVVYRFYWPGGVMTMQTLSESVVVMIAYGGTLAGLLILYRGIRRIYEPKYSTVLILLGGTLSLISFSIIWLILTSKI